MELLKKLKNVFTFAHKEPNISVENVLEHNIPLGNLNITFYQDGNASFTCNWIDDSDFVAEGLGELLFHLNSGHLKGHMIHILREQSNSNGKSNLFVQKIFEHWEGLEVDYSTAPVVSPLEVLKIREVKPLNEGD